MEVQLKQIQERRAEQAAVPFVYGVSFTDCLRLSGVATELLVEGKVIQAHRVYGAWNAFLIAIGEVTGERTTTTTRAGKIREKPEVKQPTVLTDEAEHLAKRLLEWITTSYSESYKAIKTDEEKEWLSIVIRFVVYQRIMENKYHQWITEGSGFVDEAVAHKMAKIYRLVEQIFPCIERFVNWLVVIQKQHLCYIHVQVVTFFEILLAHIGDRHSPFEAQIQFTAWIHWSTGLRVCAILVATSV